MTVVAQTNIGNVSNACTMTWNITTQNQGQFAGTFQSSGGTTAPCAQAGNLSGAIATDGRISGINFGVSVGSSAGCARTSGDGLFSGTLSGGVISVTSTDAVVCGNISAVRNLTITLGK